MSAGAEPTVEHRFGPLRPVAGGSICEAFRGGTDGEVFVKRLRDAPAGLFAAEAAGLRWLGEADALRIPAVLGAGPDWLALEWIDVDSGAGAEEALGRGLAALHAAGADAHGATAPGAPDALWVGHLELAAAPAATWAEVYAQQRLAPLVRLAGDRGALEPAGVRAVERVIDRIDRLAGPPEPPARLHGDLWSGNVLGTALVDPVAHGGHRETDLAMLRLFGGPSERCFAAYAEAAPLAEGHEDRVALWQLQPLLVHAVLFGGGYGAQVRRSAERLGAY